MEIKVTIEIKEHNNVFRITSHPHRSIPEAFAEVAPIAEEQRRLMNGRIYARYK